MGTGMSLTYERCTLIDDLSFDYSYSFPEGECAVCGSKKGVENVNIRPELGSPPVLIPTCSSCRSTKRGELFVDWMRDIRACQWEIWRRIILHNFNRMNWLAETVKDVQLEGNHRRGRFDPGEFRMLK